MKHTLMFRICLFTTLLSQPELRAQTINDYIRSNQQRLIGEYFQFLSIPNVAADSEHILLNVDFISGMMEKRDIHPHILNGITPGVTPAVFGEIKTKGATKTIGFYAHYDGQPVNPKQWHAGLEPFKPLYLSGSLEHGGTIIGPYKDNMPIDPEWRISGRGSADDKAGVMAILNAYESLIKTGNKLAVNIKFLFEGEEEVGSIHLDEIFGQNKDLLKADLWIVIDGPRHISGRKTIAFGVRGDINVA
ncbi:MAG TPA: M20/M25/M40 family metallo-hydrolase, partial [Flavisolibacter sp.]|nr:M20/M25/M40 family metallo-hydrolase [Flavisolibacter sp.]